MKQCLFSGRATLCGLLTAAVACVMASPALAAGYSDSGLAWGDTSSCSAPQLSQPFLSAKDSNWYVLAPGESSDGFDGTGWTLGGGASIQTGPLADGSTGSVLDLPSGAVAISPPVCVSSEYPTARTMVRNAAGGDGVQVYVGYAGTKTEAQPQGSGQVHGNKAAWTTSPAFGIHPGNKPGWQLVRFTLVGGGRTSDFQIYDFYVDPRMH
jgi:hypothetical protein